MEWNIGIAMIDEFNALLAARGLPRVNWTVAEGARRPRPGGTPYDVDKVCWSQYRAKHCARVLDYFTPISDTPLWINRETDERLPGVVIYESFSSLCGDNFLDQYAVIVGPRQHADEIRELLKEFTRKHTPRED